jgi:hypothetical protein
MSSNDLSDNIENDSTINTDSISFSNTFTNVYNNMPTYSNCCDWNSSTFNLADFRNLIRKADESIINDKLRRYSAGSLVETMMNSPVSKGCKVSKTHRRKKFKKLKCRLSSVIDRLDTKNDLLIEVKHVFKDKLLKKAKL